MSRYEPELGQAVFGGPWAEFDTPGFVTGGMDDIDARISEHRGVGSGLTGRDGDDDYETDVFVMRSYCWCDGEKHPDGCPPNFEHKVSGFQARWYKHSHRGASVNRQIGRKEWEAIRRECMDSIPADPCVHDREFKTHPWAAENPAFNDFWDCRSCGAYGFGERVHGGIPGPRVGEGPRKIDSQGERSGG